MPPSNELPPRYWFPAKRYGWGWRFPTTWQGWAVIAIYVTLACTGVFVLDAPREPAAFIAYLVLLTLVLVAVCWAKGEPPRGRPGERDRT